VIVDMSDVRGGRQWKEGVLALGGLMETLCRYM